MRHIWKYPIPNEHSSKVTMPTGATILRCALQAENGLCIWALVDPEAPPQERYFKVYGTGHAIRRDDAVYIGTVDAPPFVWHLFELPTLPTE